MKKIISLLFFLLGTTWATAQIEPIDVDYGDIRKYVENHPEEYTRLLERFEACDSLLTMDDFATIYYGYSFTSDYQGSMDRWPTLDKLLKEGDMEAAYAEGVALRKRNPVSLELLSTLAYLADELQKKEEVEPYFDKYFALLTVILASGDGKSTQTAFKVICINDEYQLLHNVLRISSLKQQSLQDGCDIIECEDREGNSRIYCFDISRSLEHMQKMFE